MPEKGQCKKQQRESLLLAHMPEKGSAAKAFSLAHVPEKNIQCRHTQKFPGTHAGNTATQYLRIPCGAWFACA
eukprot:5700594-Amphidinium_carterae.2